MANKSLISFIGKAKDLTLEELFMLFKFGRKVELLEVGDFSLNKVVKNAEQVFSSYRRTTR